MVYFSNHSLFLNAEGDGVKVRAVVREEAVEVSGLQLGMSVGALEEVSLWVRNLPQFIR